ncbi:oxidoreductase [Yoonia sp. R2331]|uniref:oxidoreductase n=1 Tax=Yoonia sp. R2331 TaxID=3237238 RepID=UPI0034E4823B
MFTSFKSVGLNLIFAIGLATSAIAQDIQAPEGEVLLTAGGEISVTNVDETLQFDLAALTEMDSTAFETETIWTDGVHTFEGVSLHVFADLVGAEAGTFLAAAINDYTVEIPVSDAVEGGPIIAYFMDGEEMSVRDKGPLWIIYPYDSSADYRSEVIFSRSIWQLDRIEVVK